MQKIDPIYRWSGRLPSVCVDLLPPEYRHRRVVCIRDLKAWTRVWQRWQGETTQPRIDFATQAVVILKNVRYLNRIRYLGSAIDDGVLTVKSLETRTARPVRDEVYGLVLVFDASRISAVSDGAETLQLPRLVTSE